jgi:hypothetical protein
VRSSVDLDGKSQKVARESQRRETPTLLGLARRLLYLEQQVEALQSLYDDDLARIHVALVELRKDLVPLLSQRESEEA